jgi:5-carboxymethyl-2-hydroxymuconate isomerase
MPYIHLATTSDLAENSQIPDILSALVAELSSVEEVDPKSVKSYHSLVSVWEMGEGAPAGFARCTICVLSGRSEIWRVDLADRLYAVLKLGFAEGLAASEVALTLEVREMDHATYRK